MMSLVLGWRTPTKMSKKEWKYCTACGSRISNKGIKFCPYCGTEIVLNEEAEPELLEE